MKKIKFTLLTFSIIWCNGFFWKEYASHLNVNPLGTASVFLMRVKLRNSAEILFWCIDNMVRNTCHVLRAIYSGDLIFLHWKTSIVLCCILLGTLYEVLIQKFLKWFKMLSSSQYSVSIWPPFYLPLWKPLVIVKFFPFSVSIDNNGSIWYQCMKQILFTAETLCSKYWIFALFARSLPGWLLEKIWSYSFSISILMRNFV